MTVDAGGCHFFHVSHPTTSFHLATGLPTLPITYKLKPAIASQYQKGKISVRHAFHTIRNKSPSQGWPWVRDHHTLYTTTSLTESSSSQSTALHAITSKNLAQHQQTTHNQMKPTSERVQDFQRSAASYGLGQRPRAEDVLKQWTDEWTKLAAKK